MGLGMWTHRIIILNPQICPHLQASPLSPRHLTALLGPCSVRDGVGGWDGGCLPPLVGRGGGREGEEAPGLGQADVPAEASTGAFNKT